MAKRNERLAIWQEDLERLPVEMLAEIWPHIDTTVIHEVGHGEKNELQPALEFKCPLLQAALICDVIRNYDRKVKQRPSELYIHRGLRWVRIIYSQVLTVQISSKSYLAPSFFPGEVLPDQQVRVQPKPLIRGRGNATNHRSTKPTSDSDTTGET